VDVIVSLHASFVCAVSVVCTVSFCVCVCAVSFCVCVCVCGFLLCVGVRFPFVCGVSFCVCAAEPVNTVLRDIIVTGFRGLTRVVAWSYMHT